MFTGDSEQNQLNDPDSTSEQDAEGTDETSEGSSTVVIEVAEETKAESR